MTMLAGLAACATVGQKKIAEAPSDVSCSLFVAISYAELARGLVDDAGNAADTSTTVKEIEAHNAKFDTVCGNPLKPSG